MEQLMERKCLIIYSSHSGNTEKVARRFKCTFEKHGWGCDIFKIDKKTDIHNPPFDFNDYEFVCAGSGIILHLPYNEILLLIRQKVFGIDPRIMHRMRDEEITYMKTPVPRLSDVERDMNPHRKIVVGPDSRKAIVFATYSGFEFGPKEAEPSLKLLELEIEHLGLKCIGSFCCPGKFLNNPTHGAYHGDIRDRPNEKDLLKAEMFIEEKLEEIEIRTS
jgi:hypothetical protein